MSKANAKSYRQVCGQTNIWTDMKICPKSYNFGVEHKNTSVYMDIFLPHSSSLFTLISNAHVLHCIKNQISRLETVFQMFNYPNNEVKVLKHSHNYSHS